jgi:hypothetical protein
MPLKSCGAADGLASHASARLSSRVSAGCSCPAQSAPRASSRQPFPLSMACALAVAPNPHLERLDQAQGLVHAAAHRQVVDGDLAQDARWADDEEAAGGGYISGRGQGNKNATGGGPGPQRFRTAPVGGRHRAVRRVGVSRAPRCAQRRRATDTGDADARDTSWAGRAAPRTLRDWARSAREQTSSPPSVSY